MSKFLMLIGLGLVAGCYQATIRPVGTAGNTFQVSCPEGTMGCQREISHTCRGVSKILDHKVGGNLRYMPDGRQVLDRRRDIYTVECL